ncbi:uncharacterized protein FTOL_06828 [Fusarium torulosum]|uniref:Uncharacterized protein n=1 Tax=Fusarium torulosum TaxID=33205 RepID=A0AAE8M9T2_9HYPO|nr:uncharacterized protein FTOL_06828 [Fusarium torulosum]
MQTLMAIARPTILSHLGVGSINAYINHYHWKSPLPDKNKDDKNEEEDGWKYDLEKTKWGNPDLKGDDQKDIKLQNLETKQLRRSVDENRKEKGPDNGCVLLMIDSDSMTKDGTLNRGDAHSRKDNIYLKDNMQLEDAWPNESIFKDTAEAIEMWTNKQDASKLNVGQRVVTEGTCEISCMPMS